MTDKYNKLIEKIEIENIQLTNLTSEKNPNYIPSKGNQASIALETSINNIKLNGINLSADLQFELFAYVDDEEANEGSSIAEEKTLFKILFILTIDYRILIDSFENITSDYESEIERFINKNALINAWPYARELTSTLTTKMGYPALIIPLYKKFPKV